MFASKKVFLFAVFFALACSEAPLITPSGSARLNNPVSMVLIPGTDYAIVANANVGLTQENGSLVPVDLSSLTLLTENAVSIPSFSGRISLDVGRSRIYVPDRGDDALLVYQYSIPGEDGAPISLTQVEVPVSSDQVQNGIETDDNPFDAAFIPGTPSGDLIFTTNNVSGSVTVVPTETLIPIDLNPDDGRLNGLPLISAANFKQKDRRPGSGADHLVPTPDGSLFYVTSTRTNDIYVIDPKDQKVEAMLDLSSLATPVGTRGMVIAANNLAYIVHRGLNSVIVLDVSGITDNGIDYEVVDPILIDVLPGGKDPEGIALSPDEKKLFVSNQGDNTVDVIDVETRTLEKRIAISGNAPAQLVVDATRNLLYVLNFVSNDITLINLTTEDVAGTIE